MTTFKTLCIAGITALAFTPGAALAGPFTYADERCKNASEHGVICNAFTEDTVLSNIVGFSMPFDKFLAENALLPSDATPTTKAPAYRMYVIGVKS
jgi:hypothetical protein